MSSLQVIYASTSGHTEYVVGRVADALRKLGAEVALVRAEEAAPEDFSKGDTLLLASSTWNTGNVEGQLNPHMHLLLTDRAKDVSLAGRKVALVALGDKRYRYRANAAVHLEEFVRARGGAPLLPTFKILNEPYGQEAAIDGFAKELHSALSA